MSTREERTSLKLVIGNLNKEIKQIKGHTLGGLIESAIIVRRDMEKTSPLIPVWQGNLRLSFFTVTSKGTIKAGASPTPTFTGKKAEEMSMQHNSVKSKYLSRASSTREPTIILGFSAEYAASVHEKYGARFKRPNAGAGFFVDAIYRNKRKILETIKQSARIR